jgi:hypothetical protein
MLSSFKSDPNSFPGAESFEATILVVGSATKALLRLNFESHPVDIEA